MNLNREQWRAVWRLMRMEKRMMAAIAAENQRMMETRLRDRGLSDQYEIRMVSYSRFRAPLCGVTVSTPLPLD